ncbi:L-aspartate oxidase [Tessaracoccus massiliensis]|uniref:L-aspartate oxidase n=1 Tax=Tessaracoccus massiliensis TaxID=1522311 RepID=UPI00069485E9
MTTTLVEPVSPQPLHTQVVVVGTGAAGLSTLLHLAAAGVDTVAITRSGVTDSATAWAQGGLAAVWDATDCVESHIADTLTAGAGLCNEAAVSELVAAAPGTIRRLIELGAQFDRTPTGALDLHLEGGHSHRRIIHADGDATGAEIERALWAALSQALEGSSVRILEDARLVDILTDGGRAVGVRVLPDLTIHADAVVLATGGLGQLWPVTSNPAGATGDGVAAALRAGAAVRDIEFVQFHPTVLADDAATSRGVLISEAVRGEGAVLVDSRGTRIMDGVHPLKDLAPRDVVSAAIIAHLRTTREPHAFLDATAFGAAKWERHFPGVLGLCRERGVDPVTQPIPVHPAAHYSCGGVAATLDGVTTVPGLFAVGEVAATGVHGANRLASNSLTEALVMGDRLGQHLTGTAPERGPATKEPGHDEGPPQPIQHLNPNPFINPTSIPALKAAMQSHAFVARTADGLTALLEHLRAAPTTNALTDDSLTATNLHLVATAVTTAALARQESRGAHRRADFPLQTAPHHLALTLQGGRLTCTAAPIGTGARIRDTRKTVPGLRALQKAAVVHGGGVNHRMALGDAALIKDNHVAATGSVRAAFEAVKAAAPEIPVEVECDTIAQVREAIEVGAQLVLLDNMSPDSMREAVNLCRRAGVKTEASGGLTLDTARAVAATGVDYISIGALTHSAKVLDLGLDLLTD